MENSDKNVTRDRPEEVSISEEMESAGERAAIKSGCRLTSNQVREIFAAMWGASVIGQRIQCGWVCVPATPTEQMLKEAWAAAHDENAAEVWSEMVAVAKTL